MKNRDEQILEKIVKYCNEIDDAKKQFGNNYNVFCNNSVYRNAVSLCILQIGELVGKLTDRFVEDNREIPWRAIKGMRNVVAHEYGNIDTEIVWETLESDVPLLKQFCVKFLNNA